MRRYFHEPFDPTKHEAALRAAVGELAPLQEITPQALTRAVHRYPKSPGWCFSKSDLIAGARRFGAAWGIDTDAFVRKLRLKPVRTQSGVAPVTVATAPYECPGQCAFCPDDERVPKSYLSREPSLQRAAEHAFDPYGQIRARLGQLHLNGHAVDKVELNVVGGTWSAYPESYRIWFIRRCYQGLNDFNAGAATDFEVDDSPREPAWGQATWSDLQATQQENETAQARAVGLAVELRPDSVTAEELVTLRRLGVTRVQVGVQSLDDRVLKLNRRGHDVAGIRRALRMLRLGGFKILAHIMPNLYGSDADGDVACIEQLFADPDLCPDELKLYPCALIDGTELMDHYRAGRWRPYGLDELRDVLVRGLVRVPAYCRVNRMMRDIPASYIVDGVTQSNLREVVEAELARRGEPSRDIRSREIRADPVDPDRLELTELRYPAGGGEDRFFQFVTPEERLVAFLRLSLPTVPPVVEELRGAAIIREVHVYGHAVRIGGKSPGAQQHLGLGRRLVEQARAAASAAGFERLAVISSVGTREYYRRLGFSDGPLYQHRRLP